jgi:hypothetical protein
MHARYLLDHGLATNAFPQCGPSFLVPVPLTHVPAALLDALLYQDLSRPLKLRVLGVVGSIVLLALAVALFRTVAPRVRSDGDGARPAWGTARCRSSSRSTAPASYRCSSASPPCHFAVARRDRAADDAADGGGNRTLFSCRPRRFPPRHASKDAAFLPVLGIAGWLCTAPR